MIVNPSLHIGVQAPECSKTLWRHSKTGKNFPEQSSVNRVESWHTLECFSPVPSQRAA